MNHVRTTFLLTVNGELTGISWASAGGGWKTWTRQKSEDPSDCIFKKCG